MTAGCQCFSLLAKHRASFIKKINGLDSYGNHVEDYEERKTLHVIIKNPTSTAYVLDAQREVNKELYIIFRYKSYLDVDPSVSTMRVLIKGIYYAIMEVLAGDDMDFAVGGNKYLRYKLKSIRLDDANIDGTLSSSRYLFPFPEGSSEWVWDDNVITDPYKLM